MKSGRISLTEINSLQKHSIKPNSFLEDGKRIFRELSQRNKISGSLSDYITESYRPGIFKRCFVSSIEHGYYYITAQTMNTQDAVSFAKILSTVMTQNLEPMILKEKEILVSCAGTVGNIRFIDKTISGNIGSQDIIRVVSNPESYGFVYAYLSTPTVNSYLQSQIYGSVVARIEPEVMFKIPVIEFDSEIISEVESLIRESIELKEHAINKLNEQRDLLLKSCKLNSLTSNEYDYYGPRTPERKTSTFIVNKKDITALTINAFNHSERIKKLKETVRASIDCITLKDCITDDGFFSTGSFPRVEVKYKHGIQLINQQDIFDSIIKGKWISNRGVKTDKLVEKDEIIIAGVGTLAETETFCRCIYANEYLAGKLVSGEFIRIKSNGKIPSGYLYLWLSSQYGFRFIRNTQAGTKLCRPLRPMLETIPIPVLSNNIMQDLDQETKKAQHMLYLSSKKEQDAIDLLEEQIQKHLRYQ